MKIKIVFLIISMLFFISSSTWAMRATTVQNSVCCYNKEHLNDMLQFSSSGDRGSFEAYVKMGRCMFVNGGIDVTVMDSPGMFGGITSFIYEGLKFWTTRQGLTDYRVSDAEKKK